MITPPASREPTIEVRWPRPDAALVVLGGEHDLGSAPDLDRTLNDTLAACSHLIVDISAAQFVDSSTIAALVRAKKYADEQDQRFHLVLGTTPIVERALELSQVLEVLNRVKTVEQALAD